MEIHVPQGRPHSLKNLLIELGTITLGILIALSLEGILEWNHYRKLVNEARETIRREITDNAEDLRKALAKAGEANRNIEQALQMVRELLSTRKTSISTLSLSVEVAELSSVSWQSAERTGALSHMPYTDVQGYSKVYGMQDLYAARQRQALDRLATALAHVGFAAEPEKAAPEDLRALRSQVRDLQASLYLLDQFGKELLKSYQKFLQNESAH